MQTISSIMYAQHSGPKKKIDATMHISQLICDSWERSTDSGRTRLCELDRDETLHAKLHPEHACCESTEAGWKNPERDECPAKKTKNDNGEPTPESARCIATRILKLHRRWNGECKYLGTSDSRECERGASDSTVVADNRGNDSVANLAVAETLAHLKVGRVKILGAMRKEVDPCFTDH
jgi:hypothetical protein